MYQLILAYQPRCKGIFMTHQMGPRLSSRLEVAKALFLKNNLAPGKHIGRSCPGRSELPETIPIMRAVTLCGHSVSP